MRVFGDKEGEEGGGGLHECGEKSQFTKMSESKGDI